jgi:cell division protein FtsI (penicillin-binding protein 3)
MMSSSEKRVVQLFAFLAAWGVVAIGALVRVQIVKHDEYTQKALRQHELTMSLAPVRGSIVDARGRVLAESVAAESVCADPQTVQDPAGTARTLASFPELGLSAKELEQRLRGGGSFVYLARKVPLEVTSEIRKRNLPGLFFLEEHRRSYPRQQLAANVVGYVGMDGEGLGGIEHSTRGAACTWSAAKGRTSR